MSINVFETLSLLILFLSLGYYLNAHVKFLRNNYVPAPLIGGTILSLLIFIISQFIDISIEYGDIGPVTMGIFIASIGFRFTYNIFKTTIGKTLGYFCIVILIISLQNLVSFSLGALFDKDILESAILGSVGLMGDFSITSKLTEYIGGTEFAGLFKSISDVTLYLGVLGVIITFKFFLKDKVDMEQNVKVPHVLLSPQRFLNYVAIIFFIAFIGLIPYFVNNSRIFTTAGGPLIVGMITRWVIDKIIENKEDVEVDNWIVNFIGNFSLSLLLTNTFAKANIFSFFELSPYVLFVLIVQIAWLIAFAVFFVFRVYKKDALASYIAAGTVGFSIGIPPSTMSVIQNITEVEGAQPYFLFIVPPGAAWLITILNPIEVSIFMMLFGG